MIILYLSFDYNVFKCHLKKNLIVRSGAIALRVLSRITGGASVSLLRITALLRVTALLRRITARPRKKKTQMRKRNGE